ncbi:MAG: polysaccharide deacetylase family protein [Candidatus Omnitrophica bacterium]|nr:polysaccharide deacetylase family protein [Candidatus Omnitrophota bacterium]MCM8802484.1 polysaccharide deacetylase family protein [Candidatus Omnitrophota bacterium]
MILAYHRINPWYKKDPLTVNPENFEKQINYLLKRGFKNFSFGENYIKNKTLLITFDDGFYDNFLFGLPLFKKLKIKPIIFIIVNYISTDKIWNRYKDYEKDRFLKWEEIREIIKEGVEIGSHTLSHPHLTEIDEEKAKEEIYSSKKIIEDKIGGEVKFFCYPYGEFNEKIIEFVKIAGYKYAFVTPKKNKKIRNSEYSLRRVGIYGHNSFFIFKLKIWKEYIKTKF